MRKPSSKAWQRVGSGNLLKNHSSPELAACFILLSHFCARTFGKRYRARIQRPAAWISRIFTWRSASSIQYMRAKSPTMAMCSTLPVSSWSVASEQARGSSPIAAMAVRIGRRRREGSRSTNSTHSWISGACSPYSKGDAAIELRKREPVVRITVVDFRGHGRTVSGQILVAEGDEISGQLAAILHGKTLDLGFDFLNAHGYKLADR